jgi:hypothetical protein
MRGYITDPTGPAGLRLAGDLEEPTPKPNELKPLIGMVRPWTQLVEVLQAMRDHQISGKAVLKT